jgi:hypothetical protein
MNLDSSLIFFHRTFLDASSSFAVLSSKLCKLTLNVVGGSFHFSICCSGIQSRMSFSLFPSKEQTVRETLNNDATFFFYYQH